MIESHFMNDNNFFSIDRMVEFGMGIAVSQQMAKQMNAALQNTPVPGYSTPMLNSPAINHYHVVLEGKPAGPFTETEMSRLIMDGKLKKDSYVWHPGMATWALVENVADVLKLVALAPPPFTVPSVTAPVSEIAPITKTGNQS